MTDPHVVEEWDPERTRMRRPPLRDREAATRLRDTIALHRLALSTAEIAEKRYAVFALHDFKSDGRVYDNRDEAVKFQTACIDGNQAAYVQIPHAPWDIHTCDSLVNYWRAVYATGYRPTTMGELIIPLTTEGLT